MADQPIHTDSASDDTRAEHDRGSWPGVPLWVKVFGLAAIVLVVLFVAMHLSGNSMGGHG